MSKAMHQFSKYALSKFFLKIDIILYIKRRQSQPEKCFVLEEGDELYINKWIKNRKINGKMKDIFEWIEKKYLSNKKQLEKTDKKNLMN